MEKKCLLFLLGFEVSVQDRRNGEVEYGFIIIPFAEKEPDELDVATDAILNHYNGLGYDVMEIKYQKSKVVELDVKKEYDAAPTTEQYYEEQQKGA